MSSSSAANKGYQEVAEYCVCCLVAIHKSKDHTIVCCTKSDARSKKCQRCRMNNYGTLKPCILPGDQVKPEAHALVLTAKNARKKQEELTALKEMHEQIFNKEKKAKLQKKINYVQIELNRALGRFKSRVEQFQPLVKEFGNKLGGENINKDDDAAKAKHPAVQPAQPANLTQLDASKELLTLVRNITHDVDKVRDGIERLKDHIMQAPAGQQAPGMNAKVINSMQRMDRKKVSLSNEYYEFLQVQGVKVLNLVEWNVSPDSDLDLSESDSDKYQLADMSDSGDDDVQIPAKSSKARGKAAKARGKAKLDKTQAGVKKRAVVKTAKQPSKQISKQPAKKIAKQPVKKPVKKTAEKEKPPRAEEDDAEMGGME